jgi:hypothetical protein
MPYTPVRTTERTIHSYLTKYLSELYYWDVVITETVCHIYVTLFTCVLLHIKLYLHVYCYTSNCIYMCTATHQIVPIDIIVLLAVVVGRDCMVFDFINAYHH